MLEIQDPQTGAHILSRFHPLQGTSVCQATAIGAVVILLYTSRACYNLVAVALSPQDRPSPFNYGWYSVSDQVVSDVIFFYF